MPAFAADSDVVALKHDVLHHARCVANEAGISRQTRSIDPRRQCAIRSANASAPAPASTGSGRLPRTALLATRLEPRTPFAFPLAKGFGGRAAGSTTARTAAPVRKQRE